MKSRPIRWQFALWSAALAGLVLLVFAAGTLGNLYQEQIEGVDLELDSAARYIAGMNDPARLDHRLNELVQFQPMLAVAVFDRSGNLARRSAGLPEAIARGAVATTERRTMRDGAGEKWRVQSSSDGPATTVLAFSLVEVRNIIRDLLVAFGLSLPVVSLVAALGGWWVAGRALGTLRKFTVAAEGIGADQLSRRVPVPASRDEIRRLADVLNAMLGRLEKSFQQAQRFAADASHELRTPLTVMGGEVERLLRIPDLPEPAEERLLSLQEEIGRLQRITEQMLLLARFDSGGTAGSHADVNLSTVVQLASADAELLGSSGNLVVETDIAPEVIVKGDEDHLRRLVLNLLDNATRYNRPGGTVRCTLDALPGSARLVIANSGVGIPAEARPQLFQRFFRLDGSRPRGGHGLGLSLCREIARAHGGEIELGAASGPDWTEFVVTLPRR